VAFNAGAETARVRVPLNGVEAGAFREAWPGQAGGGWQIVPGVLEATLPPRDGLVLISV
jgi:hypothetical protein